MVTGNRRERVRFMVRVRGYMSVNSPELFISVLFPFRVRVNVSNVVSNVYKQ